MLFHPCEVDEKGCLTDETRECNQYQPIVPSQALDHTASHEEAQTRAEDRDGHERDRDGDESSSVGRPGLGLRQTRSISLPGNNMRLHLVCYCEREECDRLQVRVQAWSGSINSRGQLVRGR